MSKTYKNKLVIVGALEELARFKSNAESESNILLCMDKLVPRTKPEDKSEAKRIWGCDKIWYVVIDGLNYGSQCGRLHYSFISATVPMEFIRRTSALFPYLQFHLAYCDDASKITDQFVFLGGRTFDGERKSCSSILDQVYGTWLPPVLGIEYLRNCEMSKT